MSVESLTPHIRKILTAPNTDLSTISAKRVRIQLLQMDTSLDEAWVRENKAGIDKLIAGVFEDVSRAREVNGKRKRSEEPDSHPHSKTEDIDASLQPPSSSLPIQQSTSTSYTSPTPTPTATPYHSPTKPPPKPKSSTGLPNSDESYARKLASEINARPKLPRAAAASVSKPKRSGNKATGSGSGRKKVKSRKSVESEGEERNGDGEEGVRKKAKGGFGKEFVLSQPLSALLATPTSSRPQVVKKLWNHIKSHNLQNPLNRKEILCDEGLKNVFGVERVDMFEMNKLLGGHLYEPETEV